MFSNRKRKFFVKNRSIKSQKKISEMQNRIKNQIIINFLEDNSSAENLKNKWEKTNGKNTCIILSSDAFNITIINKNKDQNEVFKITIIAHCHPGSDYLKA